MGDSLVAVYEITNPAIEGDEAGAVADGEGEQVGVGDLAVPGQPRARQLRGRDE